MKAGDIYLVKFHPATKPELKKYRPAVVAPLQTHKIDGRFVTILPLTTKSENNKFELTLKNYSCLEKDSTVLCWYFRTFSKKRLQTKIGQLRKSDVDRVAKTIQRLIVR